MLFGGVEVSVPGSIVVLCEQNAIASVVDATSRILDEEASTTTRLSD